MEGNFEASVLLLDTVWDISLKDCVEDGFVAAAPARDVLAFGDCASATAVQELTHIVSRLVEAGGNHMLVTSLYRRKGQHWEATHA